MTDHPYDECCATADQLVKDGALVFQKWTCDGCGARVVANKPNTFTTHGLHEDCGTITDIKTKGCNYLVMMTIRR